MHSISIWVPIVFTYILCLSKRTLKKKKGHPGIVILAECFLDFFFAGWVGCDGVGQWSKVSFIFFLFIFIYN